jgi:hypothetical protein
MERFTREAKSAAALNPEHRHGPRNWRDR